MLCGCAAILLLLLIVLLLLLLLQLVNVELGRLLVVEMEHLGVDGKLWDEALRGLRFPTQLCSR